MPFYFHFSDEVILPAWSVCMEMYSMAIVGWIHVQQPFFFSFLFFLLFSSVPYTLVLVTYLGATFKKKNSSNFGFASQTKSFALKKKRREK